MKKQIIVLCSLSILSANTWGQVAGLPANPTPGKCYIRTVTSPQFEIVEKRVLTRPAYTTFTKVPAEYKTVEERVLVKEASKMYVAYPPEYKTVTETITVEDSYGEVNFTPAKFATKPETIEVRPKFSGMEWKTALEDCNSPDPRDCMVLKYVEHPAEYARVNVQTLEINATYAKSPKGGKTATIKRQVLVNEARYEVVEVPAEYITVSKRVLVKDEEVVEVEVPAEYSAMLIQVLKDPGGVEKWEEIECSLTEGNELSIRFESGSAALAPAARSTIDDRLLRLMRDMPNIRVEISSYSDARGTADANLRLSQARADAVVDYLVQSGIQRCRLVAKGYGESRLKNRCADGVNCTEAEHALNRRTEFRVLSN